MSKSLKPGFKITEEQFQLFWSLWRQACAWQGWDKLPSKERDEKRYEVLESVGFISLKDVNSTDGFDDVKAELLLLAGRVSTDRDDAGQRRRLLYHINRYIAELNRVGYGAEAVETILRTRFKVHEGTSTIADLETRELVNLLFTLKSRLASHQRRAKPTPGKPPASSLQAQCSAAAVSAQNTLAQSEMHLTNCSF